MTLIKKSIYFANLLQNTKESRLQIPWKKFTSQKDPLLYAKGEVNQFIFYADVTYVEKEGEKIPLYGFSCTLKPIKLQVMPNVYEESEVFFEAGFYSSQKEGLKYFAKLRNILRGFNI